MMAARSWAFCALSNTANVILVMFALSGCKQKPPPPPKAPDIGAADQTVAATHWIYKDAGEAVRALLKRTKPKVIGFGELHQKTGSAPVRPPLQRFTKEMLAPLAALGGSDLIVETWMAAGRCGEQEKKVARKVEKTTERPPETENDVIKVLKRAKGLGLRPHILTVQCKEYEKLLDAKRGGKLDHAKLLDLVNRHLQDKALRVLAYRAKLAQKKNDQKKLKPAVVALYGGALHNDLFPHKDLKMFTYGAAVKKATGGRYVEVDLYVPEYVEVDDLLQKERWYPLLKKLPKDKVMLIQRGEGSYILVLRRGVNIEQK